MSVITSRISVGHQTQPDHRHEVLGNVWMGLDIMQLDDQADIQPRFRSRMLSNAKHRQTGKPFQMQFYQLAGKPHPFCVSMEKAACYSE